jgi:anthranilate/para-aminobenzoate synthase component II
MEFSLNNQWTRNADAILKYAKEQNDKGNPFPVFGTCLGHQLLAFLTSNYNDSILTRVHGDDPIVAPITFVNKGYLF